MTAAEGQHPRFRIRDACRQNLTRFTSEAFRTLPDLDQAAILDLGCGTGVSSLCLAEGFGARVHAVDPDADSLDWLRQKITARKLDDRIRLYQNSIFDLPDFGRRFDVILAEGLLNVVGFTQGLAIMPGLLKQPGYIILHDEHKDDAAKRRIFREQGLHLLRTFALDEQVWWEEYYSCLERALAGYRNDPRFAAERSEIEHYAKDPAAYRSIIYVLERR